MIFAQPPQLNTKKKIIRGVTGKEFSLPICPVKQRRKFGGIFHCAVQYLYNNSKKTDGENSLLR